MEWPSFSLSLSLSLASALTSSFHCVGVDISTIDYSYSVQMDKKQQQHQLQQFLIVLLPRKSRLYTRTTIETGAVAVRPQAAYRLLANTTALHSPALQWPRPRQTDTADGTCARVDLSLSTFRCLLVSLSLTLYVRVSVACVAAQFPWQRSLFDNIDRFLFLLLLRYVTGRLLGRAHSACCLLLGRPCTLQMNQPMYSSLTISALPFFSLPLS